MRVSPIVNRMAINKRFVNNMILFIIVLALCSNRDRPITCYIRILGRAN